MRRAVILTSVLAPSLALAQATSPAPVAATAQVAPVTQVAPVAQVAPVTPVAPVNQVAPAAPAVPGSLLPRILDAVRQSYNRGERPMVVFDLEGTLFDNRSRILQILKEYGEQELKSVRPQAAQLLAGASVEQIQYMLPDTLRGLGVTEEAVVNNAAVFWSQRFFTDDYLRFDTPNPGVIKFVRDLYSSGARIVYVTGRDAPRQLLGTVKQLRDHGFPIGIQGSELIMRPTVQTQDAVFKQQVTNYLRQLGKVLATFDSEPANANVYRRAFPEATCIIYSAPRAPNPPPLLPSVVALASFE